MWTELFYIGDDGHLRPTPKWNTRFAITDGSQALAQMLAFVERDATPGVAPTMSVTQMLWSITTYRSYITVSQPRRQSSDIPPQSPISLGRA